MKQFVGIFRVPVATMDEWKKTTSPEVMAEQNKKMGEDMMAWMQKHQASFVGQGMPLGHTKTVTKEGVKDNRNDLNFMQIVQAESHDAAAAIFADSPHTTIPTAYIGLM
jgi:hypothetical protein